MLLNFHGEKLIFFFLIQVKKGKGKKQERKGSKKEKKGKKQNERVERRSMKKQKKTIIINVLY